MPITKSATKALRKDKRKTAYNRPVRSRLKTAVDTVKKSPTSGALSEAFSAIDRALKRNLIHRNKAARLKSALSKKLAPAK